MAVNDVYRVAVIGVFASSMYVNTHHFRQKDGTKTLTDLANEVKTYWYTPLLPYFQSPWKVQQISIRKEPVAGTEEGLDVAISPELAGGIATGGYTPEAESVVVSRRSGNVGRRSRGRFFLPPPPDSERVHSNLSDTYRGNILTALVAALARSTSSTPTSGFEYVIYSDKAKNPDGSFKAVAVYGVSALLVADLLGSMDRRKQGRGA